MNIEKRLKQSDRGGTISKRKEHGAYNGQNRKRKIENEKFLKQDFCFTCAHTRVRVKNAGKWVIFPDVDATKYQNIAFKGVFSPVERIL